MIERRETRSDNVNAPAGASSFERAHQFAIIRKGLLLLLARAVVEVFSLGLQNQNNLQSIFEQFHTLEKHKSM